MKTLKAPPGFDDPGSREMRYHGNYCGPSWSDGKQQLSVAAGDQPAIDDFDKTCEIHDKNYALNTNLYEADNSFYMSNYGMGTKRSLAALAVKANSVLREYVPNNLPSQVTGPRSFNMVKNAKQPTKLRGAKVAPTKRTVTKNSQQLSTVPASYGFSLRMQEPRVQRTGKNTVIVGSDYATSVATSISTGTYAPSGSILLNPSFFASAMLGNVARTYEKFRFTKAVIQYIPQVPTTTAGQIVMCSTRTVKEPFINGNSPTFLSRALSQGNAVASPLWKETTLTVNCGSEWSIVDGYIDTDLDDSIQEEVQIYTTCDSVLTTGIIVLHYTIEFKDPLYSYHSNNIPNPIGNGVFDAFSDNTPINAVGDALILSNSSTTTGTPSGTIFRMVFRQQRSTLPTGVPQWNALANTVTQASSSLATFTNQITSIAMNPGTVLYGLQATGGIALFATLESAKAGASGYITYASATTVGGVYQFIISIVQVGPSIAITTQ